MFWIKKIVYENEPLVLKFQKTKKIVFEKMFANESEYYDDQFQFCPGR